MIIVTGGLGFIGNELVRQLSEIGEEVCIIDNKNRIAPDISHIRHIPIEYCDIVDYEGLLKIFKSKNPKTVFHLAAIHFIPECNANPERTLRVNVEGTSSVLRAASESGVENLIFASSGAVYADGLEKLKEHQKVAPVDIYGLSKWFGEELCRKYANNSDLIITSCRLFNNFGPRETNLHIIPEIINQLKVNPNKLRLGNIKPVRDYIHTKDTAKAFIKLMSRMGSNYEVVNLSTGNGFSVEQIIAIIGKLLNRTISVETDFSRYRKVDKLYQSGDISKLFELTKWQPEISLEEGLKSLLIYEDLL